MDSCLISKLGTRIRPVRQMSNPTVEQTNNKSCVPVCSMGWVRPLYIGSAPLLPLQPHSIFQNPGKTMVLPVLPPTALLCAAWTLSWKTTHQTGIQTTGQTETTLIFTYSNGDNKCNLPKQSRNICNVHWLQGR